MLSISTSWDYKSDTDWRAWLTKIKSFGLENIELGYTLTHLQLAQIEKLIKELNLRVSSLHSFCPTPNDEPSNRHVSNYYRLSASDNHERSQAIKWTKICIDAAVRVGAPVVVIHAGTVELENDFSKDVVNLYKDGKRDSEEFTNARDQLLKLRQDRAQAHIKNLESSLEEVVKYAQQKGIKIGLETRYYPTEMPNFKEIGHFLNLFHKYGMYYWHDVGHAEINDRLGITPHVDFLEAYKDKMIGVHLHGIKVTRDHLAPFDGDMDLDKLLSYFPDRLIRVVEARYATEDQIKTAVLKLKR